MAALCAFMACSGGVQAELPESVAQALAQAGIPDTHVGIVVQSVDGTPLLEHGVDRALNPASVMKLVTTLAALDTWGPAYTFQTRVWLDGIQLLDARGKAYPQAAMESPTAFDTGVSFPGPFPAGNPLRMVLPQGLTDDKEPMALPAPQGAVRVDKLVGGPPGVAKPVLNGLTFQLNAGNVLGIEGGRLVLEGPYSQACGDKVMSLNLDSPPATAGAWFSALWRELGGTLTGQVRERTGDELPGSQTQTPTQSQLLLNFDSRPLSDLVRDVNKHSNNVMAKMLFLNLGVARLGGAATWEKGDQALRGWLADQGLVLPKLVLQNGSGLSRIERLSAGDLARLLAWAAHRPAYYEFAASLPAVGMEGTLRRRFSDPLPQGLNLKGQAWLKTGSLNGARNLAGYVLGPAGERRILVFMVNHPRASQAEAVQSALLAWAVGTPKNGARQGSTP